MCAALFSFGGKGSRGRPAIDLVFQANSEPELRKWCAAPVAGHVADLSRPSYGIMSVMLTGIASGVLVGSVMMYIAWVENPQYEFHGPEGVSWGYWLFLGVSWAAAVFLAVVLIGLAIRVCFRALRGSA